MGKIGFHFIIVLLMFLFCLDLHSKELKIVTLQYPPYEYEEYGKIEGIAVDLIKEAFKRMDQPIEIKLYPFARAIKMVEKGEADAIFTLFKTQERESFVDYSNEVLITQKTYLYVLKDSPITYDGDLGKLNNYTFGKVLKVTYGQTFEEAVKAKKITKFKESISGEANMDLLLNKKIDILVSHKEGVQSILKKKFKTEYVKELEPDLDMISSYMAFSKKSNLEQLRDKFDKTLRKMKEDGSYQRIVKGHR